MAHEPATLPAPQLPDPAAWVAQAQQQLAVLRTKLINQQLAAVDAPFDQICLHSGGSRHRCGVPSARVALHTYVYRLGSAVQSDHSIMRTGGAWALRKRST